MLNVRYAQMEIIQMTILLSFAACVTLVCINVVLVWLKFLQKVGFVMFAWLLDQLASIYLVHFVMLKEEP